MACCEDHIYENYCLCCTELCDCCGLGVCDTCGLTYDVSSRDGRCGDCGDCGDCCVHSEKESN